MRLNYWRKAYLARYGRQGVLQWDNVLVTEMNLHLQALAEIVKKENDLTAMAERYD